MNNGAMESSQFTELAGNRMRAGSPLLRLRSDHQLVERYRLGCDEAFGALYSRYADRLTAYVRQMMSSSKADAEDVVQDAFIRAHAALRSGSEPNSPKAWLYQIAHNRCIDYLRRPAHASDELLERVERTDSDPFADMQQREGFARLIEDIRRLPEQQRSALLLREMEGLSYEQLADVLGVTIPSVKSLLVRARMGLAEFSEARNADCSDIRMNLMESHDRGVRSSALARRHMAQCSDCGEYRSALKTTHRQIQGLLPAAPFGLALLGKLLSKLSGSSSSSTATGSASAGGGIAAGGGLLSATSGKVAAVVCCAAVSVGGTVSVTKVVQNKDSTDSPDQVATQAITPASLENPLLAAAPTGGTLEATEGSPETTDGALNPAASAPVNQLASTTPAQTPLPAGATTTSTDTTTDTTSTDTTTTTDTTTDTTTQNTATDQQSTETTTAVVEETSTSTTGQSKFGVTRPTITNLPTSSSPSSAHGDKY